MNYPQGTIMKTIRAILGIGVITACLVAIAMSVLWWPRIIVPTVFVALPLAVFWVGRWSFL
jgi:hypothetical protein